MKVGLSNLLFVRSSVEKSVEKCAELGADFIEIIYDFPHFMPGHDPHELRALRRLIEHNGLGVSVHGSFWDLNPASHRPELWKLSLDQAKKSLQACSILGGKITVLHLGRCPISDLKWFMDGSKRLYDRFIKECLGYARKLDITIALENMDLSFIPYSTLPELNNLTDRFDGLKVCLDVGHAYRKNDVWRPYQSGKTQKKKNREAKIARNVKRLGDKIVHVHFHDNHGGNDDHLVPGQGKMNFGPIVKAIKGTGFDGFVVIELFDPGNAEKAGRAGLEATRRIFGL
ncbi:MAG: sugar phosphate isomerase/epimerase [Candidatus Hadarchaeota archaeon]